MSNQEPQNPNPSTEDVAVEKRRQFIKSAGIGAVPVILTLASPSVFGQEMCLSQQMSGNASAHPGNCVLGHAPSFWKSPVNKNTWPSPYFYGTGTSTTQCGNLYYNGGTAFNDSVLGFSTSTLTSTMRTVLCASTTPSDNAIWVTALLNSVTVANYILSKQQVLDLYKNVIAPPPPYTNDSPGKISFLKTTWVGN